MPLNLNDHDQLAIKLQPMLLKKLHMKPSNMTIITFASIAKLMIKFKPIQANSRNQPDLDWRQKMQTLIQDHLQIQIQMPLLNYQLAIPASHLNDYQNLIKDYTQGLISMVNTFYDDPEQKSMQKTKLIQTHQRLTELQTTDLSVLDSLDESEFIQSLIQSSHYLTYQIIAMINDRSKKGD